MDIKIYTWEKKDTNDAVVYYLQVVKEALEDKYNQRVEQVFSVKEVRRKDIVVVISPAAYLYILMRNPFQKVIFWFQGIFAEEVSYLFRGMKNWLKVKLFSYLEYHILKHACFVIFVSEAMRRYYQKKFGYRGNNYVIIPCFNKQKTLSHSQFITANKDKYAIPSFVYAGSINRWQCVDEAIRLFSLIKEHIPNALLTLLTKDKKEAEILLKKYGVVAKIKYVSLEELDNELLKYKYGFILRRNIPLNRVATPTKLSAYLSGGIIPIYSTVIESFNQIFENKKYVIKAADIDHLENLCNQICSFDKKPIDVEALYEEYSSIFNDFYNEIYYKNQLKKALDTMNL